jgi:hypothetical protein
MKEKMNKEESKIVCELNLDDFKYISVRLLYFNWFFSVGAETANQLIDNTIKLYLRSRERLDLVSMILKWGGNECHNIVRIIELCIKELELDFDFENYKIALENIYKIYQIRYLENLKKTGEIRVFLKDIKAIDYSYKYFRDKIGISEHGKRNTLIYKLLNENDLGWGEDNVSLRKILLRKNDYFILN